MPIYLKVIILFCVGLSYKWAIQYNLWSPINPSTSRTSGGGGFERSDRSTATALWWSWRWTVEYMGQCQHKVHSDTPRLKKHVSIVRDHHQFVYASSQRETTLQCNVVSHWLGAFTKRSVVVTLHNNTIASPLHQQPLFLTYSSQIIPISTTGELTF